MKLTSIFSFTLLMATSVLARATPALVDTHTDLYVRDALDSNANAHLHVRHEATQSPESLVREPENVAHNIEYPGHPHDLDKREPSGEEEERHKKRAIVRITGTCLNGHSHHYQGDASGKPVLCRQPLETYESGVKKLCLQQINWGH